MADLFDEIGVEATPAGDIFDELTPPAASRPYDYLPTLSDVHPPGSPEYERRMGRFYREGEERPAAFERPLVNIPAALIEQLGMGPPGAKLPFVHGLAESVAETASGLTSPKALATLPAFLIPVVREALMAKFGGEALGTGAGEIAAGFEQGDPRLAGHGVGTVGGGAAMLAPLPRSIRATAAELRPPIAVPPVIPTPEPTAPQLTEVLNALQVRQTTPVLRDVPQQPVQRPGPVPALESLERVPRSEQAQGAPPGNAPRPQPAVEAGAGELSLSSEAEGGAAKVPVVAAPQPNWRVSVQAPITLESGEVMPGNVQIVDPNAPGEAVQSPTVESLRAAGHDVPDFSKLPQGRYTWEEAVKLAAPKAAPPSWASVLEAEGAINKGRLGDTTSFTIDVPAKGSPTGFTAISVKESMTPAEVQAKIAAKKAEYAKAAPEAPTPEPAAVPPIRLSFDDFLTASREGRLLEELRKLPKSPKSEDRLHADAKLDEASAAVDAAKLSWIYDRTEPSKRQMVEAVLRRLPRTKKKIVDAYEQALNAKIKADMAGQRERQRALYDALVERGVIESPVTGGAPTSPVEPPPAGPGAASPSELAERRANALRGTPPLNAPPPATISADATPSPELARRARDFTLLNNVNSPQFTFWFGKLGVAASKAWQRIALGEYAIREGVGRDIQFLVKDTLAALSRSVRAKGGRAFFDALNGKDLADIESEWQDKPGGDAVIAQARVVKDRLESIRTTIRDTKRDALSAYLSGLDKPTLDALFKESVSDKIDISDYTKQQLAGGLTRASLPDDWGIADGSYLPHLFFGNWRVQASLPGVEGAQFVFRARTPAEARARIYKHVRDNPEFADAHWTVGQDTVIPADMIRLGDRRFWQLIGKMKEQATDDVNVREAMRGIIGRKASKTKWWGSLQQRQGFENYSRDYKQVMGAYLSGFHRWKELSGVNREVQPLIEQVRAEGRPDAAAALDDLLDYVWGKPARSTREFDNLIQRLPILRDYIKPLALDRWSRNTRKAAALLTLTNARFAVVNRLQPLQGLYPLIGERLLIKAKLLQHTDEGRTLLDEAGVRFDPGQYSTGAGRSLRERLTGEASNQELAFLGVYLHGLEKGLDKPAAITYGKLRGQLMTQFTPLLSDVPPSLRGPFASTLFQFKRFPIKQAELLSRLVAERNLPGIARWLGAMTLVGGASYFLRQFYAAGDTKERLKRAAHDTAGDTGGDAILYGLPGLLGADLSGSLVLGDEPFGDNLYEKIGRQVTGPGISLAYETGKALATARRQTTTKAQDIDTLLRRYPSLRPLAELRALLQSDYDLRTPDGEARYRRTLKDVLLGLGSFRSARESNQQTAVNAIVVLQREMNSLKNDYFVQSEQGDATAATDAISKFNERWPELALRAGELQEYVTRRRKGASQTDVERLAGRRFRPLVEQP